jgi:hypothetical protein
MLEYIEVWVGVGTRELLSEESQILKRIFKVRIKFATLLIVHLLITAQSKL